MRVRLYSLIARHLYLFTNLSIYTLFYHVILYCIYC